MPTHRRHSYAEYLAFEEASDVKHEHCDGAIVAMAGGTPEHALLKSNLMGLDVYRRLGDNAWERHGYGPGERVPLGSLEISLEMDALYDGWADLVATPPPASAPSPGG